MYKVNFYRYIFGPTLGQGNCCVAELKTEIPFVPFLGLGVSHPDGTPTGMIVSVRYDLKEQEFHCKLESETSSLDPLISYDFLKKYHVEKGWTVKEDFEVKQTEEWVEVPFFSLLK